MSAALKTARQEERGFLADLKDRLRDPFQVRAMVAALLGGVCYIGVSLFLGGEANAAAARLGAERRRVELVREIVRLRADHKLIEKHLPSATSATGKQARPAGDGWTRCVLEGLRPLPVKLVTFDFEKPRTAGPYKVAVLRIVLEGQFKDVNAFLRWLDANDRLIRVDRLQMEAAVGKKAVVMQVIVLGVMNP